MTREPELEELTREDARFVERLRSIYEPEPQDGARRAAFEARLQERIARPRWPFALIPAFTAAALALVVWNSLPGAPAPKPAPTVTASAASAAAWEEVLFEGDPTEVQAVSVHEELPPDYKAIELAFFDGV
jgi:hypothetical protein